MIYPFRMKRLRHRVAKTFLMLVIVMILNSLLIRRNNSQIYAKTVTNTLQTSKTTDAILSSYGGLHTNSNSSKPKHSTCTKDTRNDTYMTIRFRVGRTGNALFQLFCLLSFSSRYCYTAILDNITLQSRQYGRLLETFEISNTSIQRVEYINMRTFHSFTRETINDVETTRQNWTLKDRCMGYPYLHEKEDYIKSSVRFRPEIQDDVHHYLNANFSKRSTVAIHVRRTDKVHNNSDSGHNNLEWYKPFIEKAVQQLKANYSNLSFIFVSDDLQWCKYNFVDENMYFSPFVDVGRDLALIANCDHVILTIGTFGWMGAWLGEHKTVIYRSNCVTPRLRQWEFYSPSWLGIED